MSGVVLNSRTVATSLCSYLTVFALTARHPYRAPQARSRARSRSHVDLTQRSSRVRLLRVACLPCRCLHRPEMRTTHDTRHTTHDPVSVERHRLAARLPCTSPAGQARRPPLRPIRWLVRAIRLRQDRRTRRPRGASWPKARLCCAAGRGHAYSALQSCCCRRNTGSFFRTPVPVPSGAVQTPTSSVQTAADAGLAGSSSAAGCQ